MIRKLLFWAFVAFAIFMMAFRPETSAVIVKTLGSGILTGAEGFGDFLSRVFT